MRRHKNLILTGILLNAFARKQTFGLNIYSADTSKTLELFLFFKSHLLRNLSGSNKIAIGGGGLLITEPLLGSGLRQIHPPIRFIDEFLQLNTVLR